jgi:hypothetical protein
MPEVSSSIKAAILLGPSSIKAAILLGQGQGTVHILILRYYIL